MGGEDNVTGSWDALIYTLNAGAWQLLVGPNPPDFANNGLSMTGVSCPDDDDCVAVGGYLDSSDVWHGVLSHARRWDLDGCRCAVASEPVKG